MAEGDAVDRSMPAMVGNFNRQVRPFIDLVDRLRQHGLEQDVSLPSIVVVGDQSSGKSSVLEALSGVQLPRGIGIVTRCPLELRLKSCERNGRWRGRIRYRPQGQDFDNDEDDFGVDEEIEESNEVEARVRTAQNLLAGPDRGISRAHISLEITSPDVPDLTLIDLPGITRLNVRGQNNDASETIRVMIQDYIKRDETIILAVVPANVDIATTEALQMAKEVDREGKRTLGVVTKADLVDKGAEEEVVDVVSNTRYHLRRGFTLVKCRGQDAIKRGMTLRDALDEEQRFFMEHQSFKNVPDAILGMNNLSKKLTDVLVEHIKQHLPSLKVEVREKLERVNRDLAQIGDGIPQTRHEQIILLTRVLQTFTEALGKIEEGNTRFGNNHDLNPYKMARVSFTKFADDVQEHIPLNDDRKFKEKIKIRITQTRGRELPRFISFQACDEIIKEIVTSFLPLARICLAEVNETVSKILNEVAHQTMSQYRDLEMAVKDQIHEIQLRARDVCEKEIEKIFRQEKLVYTQDRTYSATYDSVLEIKREREAQTERLRASVIPKSVRSLTLFSDSYNSEEYLSEEADHTFEMIISYMNVSGKRICDSVPMTILYYMVKELCETIREQVWTLLSEDPSKLLSEEPELAVRRESLRRKSERLQAAQLELRKF